MEPHPSSVIDSAEKTQQGPKQGLGPSRSNPGLGRRLLIGAGLGLVACGAILFGVVPEATRTIIWQHMGAYAHPHAPRLDLVLDAPVSVKLHMMGAVLAMVIGTGLLLGVKGNLTHRILGWTWSGFMILTAISSFFIHLINPHGLSLIHGLSAWVIVAVPFGIYAARRKQVQQHARTMSALFMGGLVVAGLFTLMPGRLMWQIFFG